MTDIVPVGRGVILGQIPFNLFCFHLSVAVWQSLSWQQGCPEGKERSCCWTHREFFMAACRLFDCGVGWGLGEEECLRLIQSWPMVIFSSLMRPPPPSPEVISLLLANGTLWATQSQVGKHWKEVKGQATKALLLRERHLKGQEMPGPWIGAPPSLLIKRAWKDHVKEAEEERGKDKDQEKRWGR